ncbi:MAG: hypothetical protein GX585_04425 [Clostridiales bacterium]|nr:hypothetical protein [Clostridiales bacterium]
MASTAKTEHYALNQWEGTDPVLRDDFNADNQKLDAALAQKCGAVVGFYVGSGSLENVDHFIDLGFTPLAVILGPDEFFFSSYSGDSWSLVGIFSSAGTKINLHSGPPTSICKLVEGGFTVSNYVDRMNRRYNYIAFRGL